MTQTQDQKADERLYKSTLPDMGCAVPWNSLVLGTSGTLWYWVFVVLSGTGYLLYLVVLSTCGSLCYLVLVVLNGSCYLWSTEVLGCF